MSLKLREGYSLAKCCKATPEDGISGYHSHNQIMIVHRSDCENLVKVEDSRIVSLRWQEILADAEFAPEADYEQLEDLDWRILKHHQVMGVDYSHVVARALNAAKEDVFEHHRKLRELKLLTRVKPLMMRYRKGIVDNKWIKHRNHTYYELTPKGLDYLVYHERGGQK